MVFGNLGDDAKVLEEMPSRVVLWELGDGFPIDRAAVGDVRREFVEGVVVLVHPGWRVHQPGWSATLLVHRPDQVFDRAGDQHPGGIRARLS